MIEVTRKTVEEMVTDLHRWYESVLVVSSRRERDDGEAGEVHYAKGPIRRTKEEAMADARLFERMPAVRAALVAIIAHEPPADELSDPEGGRWVGDAAITAARLALGVDRVEQAKSFVPGEAPF